MLDSRVLGLLPALCLVLLNGGCATTHSPGHGESVIALPSDIVFRSAAGDPVELGSGDYWVAKAGPTSLSFTGGESGKEVVVAAIASKHQEKLSRPLALSIDGEEGRHDIVLLLPGGEQLDATGYAGGVAPRGGFRRVPSGRVQRTARLKLDRTSPVATAAQSAQGVLAEQYGNLFPDMGYVGIGTREPAAKLDVRGKKIKLTDSRSPSITLSASGDGGGAYTMRAEAATGTGKCKFAIRNDKARRDLLNVHPNGKVVVGPTYSQPSQRNFKPAALDVRTSANPSPGMGIQYAARFANSGGSGSGVIVQCGYEHQSSKPIECLRLASFEGPAKFIFFNDGESSGLSDMRLKTNVRPIENVLERLESVRGVNFEWKKGSRTQVGLVAQEVEAAFPELVNRIDDFKGVDYMRFSAVLLEAVKQLNRQTRQLREDNRALRERIEALER